ncbi:MAG: thioredoxin domain-containing protein [Acidobacteriota bacterium]
MKKAILVLVIVAVAAIIGFKLAGRKSEPQPQPAPVASQQSTGGKPIFYLFHDPSDQDAGCRRIYAFADRCETELAGKVEVKRPDVEREKNLVEQYQVRVLPTILIASPTGEVQERFEGEDKATAERIDQSLSRLKERMQ